MALIPWHSRRVGTQVGQVTPALSSFQNEINRMFDDFLTGFELEPVSKLRDRIKTFTPTVDVVDGPEQLTVTAELPGIDEKDINLTVTNDFLSIKGEKKEEHEKKEGKDRYYLERSYGAFERVIPLTAEVDEDKIDASFNKGVLTIKLPKTAAAKKQEKKISVRAGA